MKFPTIVYKLGGRHRGPKGTTYDYISVADKKEYDEAIRNGWLSDLHKAVEKKDVVEKPSKKRKATEATGEGIETKSGEKLILGKPGVIKRKSDYAKKKKKEEVKEEVVEEIEEEKEEVDLDKTSVWVQEETE